MSAGFRWKKKWHVELERALPVSVSQKKSTGILMFIINESVKTDLYFWQRRWNYDQYECNDCGCDIEKSCYDSFREHSDQDKNTVNL